MSSTQRPTCWDFSRSPSRVCGRCACGSECGRNVRAVRRQDAHSHSDAVVVVESRGNGVAVLRSPGCHHPGGLGLNSLFSWWWADPVAACFSFPFSSRRDWRTLRVTIIPAMITERNTRIMRHTIPGLFCRSCLFGLRTCRAACCQAPHAIG